MPSLSTLFFWPAGTSADDMGNVTTVPVPEGGKPVIAKTDNDGTIHLLYDSEHGPKYARSANGGLTFGRPISVVVAAPPTKGLAYSACDMAIGNEGRIHVAVGTNAWEIKLPEHDWGFFYANLDPGAAAFYPCATSTTSPSRASLWPPTIVGKSPHAGWPLDDKREPAPPAEITRPDGRACARAWSPSTGHDGSTLVAWKNQGQLAWQLYDVDGQPKGSAGSPKSPGNGVAGVVGKHSRFILFR